LITVYLVEEQVPAPFWPVNISHGGVFDPTNRVLRFGPFQDHTARTLSYVVQIPIGDCERPKVITGQATADGIVTPILGDVLFGPTELFPADLSPTDGWVSSNEVAAYGVAWRQSQSWPLGPSPVPLDYVARAAALWRGNDAYYFDPQTITNPPTLRWLNFGAPFPMCVRYPSPLPTGVAASQLPATYVPAQPFTVVLTVTSATNITACTVEDQPPAGWAVSSVSSGGEFDAPSGKVKFGPFLGPQLRTLSYQVTPPAGAHGDQAFVGAVSFDGVTVAITGARMIRSTGIPQPPSITTQPVSQTNFVGSTATFSVAATGTPPLSYQWSLNAGPLAGATNATLVLTNVQLSHLGRYRVMVSNVTGSDTSPEVSLTVIAGAPSDQWNPAIASSSDQYFVVWADWRQNQYFGWSLFGARLAPNGRVLDAGGIPLAGHLKHQSAPSVASDGQGFFAVFEDELRGLVGVRVTGAGQVLDCEGIPIAAVHPFHFGVGWNGTNYLIVWDTGAVGVQSQSGGDIYGARVSRAAVVLDRSGFPICTQALNQVNPRVVGRNGDFFAVWFDDREISIRGTRVTDAGWVVHPEGLVLSQGPAGEPNLGANQSGYLAVWVDWQEWPTRPLDISARRISGGGELAETNELAVCRQTANQVRPAVAGAGEEFFAVWLDARSGYSLGEVYGARVGAAGVMPPDGFPIAGTDFASCHSCLSGDYPAVASLHGQYLVVWTGKQRDSYGSTDIFGARVSQAGAVQETNGFIVSSQVLGLPVITFYSVGVTGYVSQSATFSPSVTGLPPLSYQWLFNGQPIAGATNQVLVATNLQLTDAGAYSLRVSNLVGVVTSLAATLTVLPPRTGPGSFDPTFQAELRGHFGVHDAVVGALAKQPDGKFIIGGWIGEVGGLARTKVARLLPDGSVDAGFAPVLQFPQAGAVLRALAVEPDGQVLVGGPVTNVNGVSRDQPVTRLHSDGGLDASLSGPELGFQWIQAVVLQSNGDILAAGYLDWRTNRVVRFRANGDLDPGFTVNLDGSSEIFAMVVQVDDRIVIGGNFVQVNGVPRRGIARLNANGTVDASFNPGTGVDGEVRALALQADGKILVGGDFNRINGIVQPNLACLNPDGSGAAGFAPLISEGNEDEDCEVKALVVQPDGRILMGGSGFTQVGGLPRRGLARLLADGEPDRSFDPGWGPGGGDPPGVHAILLQDDGKIVVGGEFNSFDGYPCNGLVRLNGGSGVSPVAPTIVTPPVSLTRLVGETATFTVEAAGTPPPSYQWQRDGVALPGATNATLILSNTPFTQAGRYTVIVSNASGAVTSVVAMLTVLPALPSQFCCGEPDPSFRSGLGDGNRISALAVQADGRILIGAWPAVARLYADGSLDTSFSCVITGQTHHIVAQPDGKILAAGYFSTGGQPLNVARLNLDGTLDLEFNVSLGTDPKEAIHNNVNKYGGRYEGEKE
jgi:uncharacterized delta-60 repeat protein